MRNFAVLAAVRGKKFCVPKFRLILLLVTSKLQREFPTVISRRGGGARTDSDEEFNALSASIMLKPYHGVKNNIWDNMRWFWGSNGPSLGRTRKWNFGTLTINIGMSKMGGCFCTWSSGSSFAGLAPGSSILGSDRSCRESNVIFNSVIWF